MDPWQQHTIPDGVTRFFSFGRFSLWIGRTGRDWLYAFRIEQETLLQEPATEGLDCEFPADIEQKRYVAADSSGRLRFRPVMPDRPVVGSADTPFALGPGVEARFYASIPVWISVYVGGGDGRPMFEAPTQRLSNTWFGGVITGRLCYSLSRKLVFQRSELSSMEDLAICAVRFRNQTKNIFSSGKVAIFADMLSVFRRRSQDTEEPRLWTNEAIATVLGPEQLNLSVGENLPYRREDLEQLSRPRVPGGENLLRKSLVLLRTITNY